MDLLTVVKAPCAPFSTRRRGHSVSLDRYQRRSRIVQCAAEQRKEHDEQDSLAKQLGRACAPFAAAVLLLVEFSLRRCILASHMRPSYALTLEVMVVCQVPFWWLDLRYCFKMFDGLGCTSQAQANSAAAETQFESSLRRQQEFFSGSKGGGFDSFFKTKVRICRRYFWDI